MNMEQARLALHPSRLVAAARDRGITYDALWRAAAFDFLEACFAHGIPHEIITERRDTFERVNARYQPL